MLRSIPHQRGFNQPCPLWQSECTIYHSPHYPRFCHTYKCRLLKKVLDGNTALPDALTAIAAAKALIRELEELLPDSSNPNFRERLVAQLERTRPQEEGNLEIRRRATALLATYEELFGVDDVNETS